MEDMVNHPSHYEWLKEKVGVEPKDICKHFNFNLGNALKYIMRAGRKWNETEDLKKAIFYLQEEIKDIEGKVASTEPFDETVKGTQTSSTSGTIKAFDNSLSAATTGKETVRDLLKKVLDKMDMIMLKIPYSTTPYIPNPTHIYKEEKTPWETQKIYCDNGTFKPTC